MGSRRFAAALVCALAGVTSCYSPSVDSCVYACNQGRCPDGLVCNTEALCVETSDMSCSSAGFPETQIDMKPADLTNQSSATFVFSSPGGGTSVTFECALGDEEFAHCVSPKTYSQLPDGSQTFQVRAVGDTGLADASPASASWVIDTVAPDTDFMTTPTDPSAPGTSFTIESSEPGSTFECDLDGAGFQPCTATQALTSLGDGSHMFRARATDAAGNLDNSPASYVWSVDAVAPTVAFVAPSPVEGATSGPHAKLAWMPSETPATMTCKLDGAPVTCTTNMHDSSLPNGPHTFKVDVTDAVGNNGTATRMWSVDCQSALTGTGRTGLYHFDEAAGVQTLFDSQNAQSDGILGTSSSVEMFVDPVRVTPGRLGSGGLLFDAGTETATANNGSIGSPATSVTAEIWFRPVTASAQQHDVLTIGSGELQLYQVGNAAAVQVAVTVVDLASISHTIVVDTTANVWHQLIATYSGTSGTLTFYVDGVAAPTMTFAANPPTFTTSQLRFGKKTHDAAGEIDEAFIASTALTAAQALDHYCPLQ